MMIVLRLIALTICVFTVNAFAWNATGHKLIAQIAYNNLTKETRTKVNELNHALDLVYPIQSFVNAAVWLDTIRYQDIKWYDRFHYVNWPFTKDQSILPAIESVNALWAINNAMITLKSKYAKPFDKGLALRVLIHVVGDVHQPLHATTLVSTEYPKGDAGGNLYRIQGGKIGKNLHAYWDKGAGLLMLQDNTKRGIDKKAIEIGQHWPCANIDSHSTAQDWLKESHELGLNKAYTIAVGEQPSAQYQMDVQMISEQRVAQAGCRLAALLNNQNIKRGKY